MLARYVVRELVRNPRRSVVSLMGVTLSIGLFSAVLFFVDGSSASMTSRALAPLAIDMQRVLASPLGKGLTLTESVSTAGSLRDRETTTVTLELRNRGSEPVHDVVVKDEPPVPLTYVGGSTTVGGRAVRDVAGSPPLAHGPARLGLNLGTVDAGASVRLAYRGRADRAVPEVGALRLRAMVSSRENPLPSPANSAAQLSLPGLAKRIGRLPGVAAADPLAFVDLPAGALRAHGVVVDHPVRVFGFGSGYGAHHSGIRLVRGSRRSGSALISAEAARATGAGPGSTVTIRLPGRHPPLRVTVGGITDVSRARSLFYSRPSSNLEKFLYVPDSVVLDLPTFQHTVLPAFRAEQSRVGAELKTTPFLELDVSVRRADLQADPASALAQTRALATRVRQVGQGRDYLIDNISNTLAVAADDAVVAKKMFLFLGLPAGLLAAFLTFYTANVLATTTRRETGGPGGRTPGRLRDGHPAGPGASSAVRPRPRTDDAGRHSPRRSRSRSCHDSRSVRGRGRPAGQDATDRGPSGDLSREALRRRLPGRRPTSAFDTVTEASRPAEQTTPVPRKPSKTSPLKLLSA